MSCVNGLKYIHALIQTLSNSHKHLHNSIRNSENRRCELKQDSGCHIYQVEKEEDDQI